MQIEVIELRYSLNGITESQLNLLFSNISSYDGQIILKRITTERAALSVDDLIIEGAFPLDFVESLSRSYPPPLSFKLQTDFDITAHFKPYSSFSWQNNPTLYAGITFLPFFEMQKMIQFQNAWQFLRLINTSEAGSILKPLLVVKPKGIVAMDRNILTFYLPMHRVDLLVQWVEKLAVGEADLNWISGTTGELTDELIRSVGSMDQELVPTLNTRLETTSTDEDIDFAQLFKRVLTVVNI